MGPGGDIRTIDLLEKEKCVQTFELVLVRDDFKCVARFVHDDALTTNPRCVLTFLHCGS